MPLFAQTAAAGVDEFLVGKIERLAQCEHNLVGELLRHEDETVVPVLGASLGDERKDAFVLLVLGDEADAMQGVLVDDLPVGLVDDLHLVGVDLDEHLGQFSGGCTDGRLIRVKWGNFSSHKQT